MNDLRRWITLCEARYDTAQLYAEIVSSGDLEAFNALAAALPDWTESGTQEAFTRLTNVLRPIMQYTRRIVRPNLTQLYFGTEDIPNPQIGMVLPRPHHDFHHWTAVEATAHHFATLADRSDPRYGHGCIAAVPAHGVVLDVFRFTGVLIEMPDLPFNQQHGTKAWESGWLEDEIITYRNTAPARVIWTAS